MDKQLGNLHIVGVGPGSSAYLTMQAKQIIEQSDVIAGYELSLNAVRESLSNKKVLVQTVENLSLENERIFHGRLSGILKESFTYLSVMVIGV